MSAKDDKCWECGHPISKHSGEYRVNSLPAPRPKTPGHGCLAEGCNCRRWFVVVDVMARPLAYLECVLKYGHKWGPYDKRRYENLLGLKYRVRWCEHCGKQDILSPW